MRRRFSNAGAKTSGRSGKAFFRTGLGAERYYGTPETTWVSSRNGTKECV